MGKLNIAHHKSYHPYRRDNIEKVRRDEEEARLKEEKEEGRMLLAVSPDNFGREMNFNWKIGFRSPYWDAPRESWDIGQWREEKEQETSRRRRYEAHSQFEFDARRCIAND